MCTTKPCVAECCCYFTVVNTNKWFGPLPLPPPSFLWGKPPSAATPLANRGLEEWGAAANSSLVSGSSVGGVGFLCPDWLPGLNTPPHSGLLWGVEETWSQQNAAPTQDPEQASQKPEARSHHLFPLFLSSPASRHPTNQESWSQPSHQGRKGWHLSVAAVCTSNTLHIQTALTTVVGVKSVATAVWKAHDTGV